MSRQAAQPDAASPAESYSEKYAGSEWSSRPVPTPGAARSRSPWLLALGAVAMVAALVTAYLILPQGQERLDRRFGTDGIVTTEIVSTAYGPIADFGPLVLQPDGRVVAAGLIGFDFALTRNTPEGWLDPSFGGDGLVRTDVGGMGRVWGLAIQPDGMILAVGEVQHLTPGAPTAVVLARYRPDGDLDLQFGNDGTVTASGWTGHAAVAVQPDGRIVVAGTGLARLAADGSTDESFGRHGLVEVPGSGLTAVALQPDGKIVVAGDILARYDLDGKLDLGFGSGGDADTTGLGALNALALQPDGRIVVGGDVLARYSSNGQLDRSFGSGGTVAGPGSGALHAVAIEPDGRIVVGGTGASEGGHFALGRYAPDGTVDQSFGDAGVLTTDVGGGDAGVRALAIQPDGKIVAAGYRRSTGCGIFGCGFGGTNLLIARYDGR
jgi:uncharacterized delta-60 repeat protein